MNYTSNPTAEMNAELTQIINEDRYARTLANIARRAENLWEDGYTAKMESNTAFFQYYTVKSPAGDIYSVCLSDEPKHEVFGDYCTCPAFPKYGECKHHLACQWMSRDEAQASAFDAMMANAEGPFGTDPDVRF